MAIYTLGVSGRVLFSGILIAVRITKLAITEQFICLTGFVSALTLNLLSNFCLFVSGDVSALGIYIRKIPALMIPPLQSRKIGMLRGYKPQLFP